MSIDLVLTAQNFIIAYREIEKASPKMGQDLIRYLEKHKSTAQHLCDSWLGRNQDWGSFYLNLSHEFQYKILKFWGMEEQEGDEYVKQVEKNPQKMLFAPVPDCIMWPHQLLIFFNNHGISEKPTNDVFLTRLPGEDRQYGNSANWGDYLLSLPLQEQQSVIQQIAAYAKLKD